MASNITPIFIFSLPRSGSTLAQRILATHSDIATATEPWILLPFLYTLRQTGIFAEYGHKSMVEAVGDFCKTLPNGFDDYYAEMREFVLRLYKKAANTGANCFLDKTPRNHLIVEEIINLFPNGKFIFLWRNPLAVTASILDTFGVGKWRLYDYRVDMFDGLSNLVSAYKKYQHRACSVHYELLINNPEQEWRRIFAYLDIPFDEQSISQFHKVNLKGGAGDQTGTKLYQTISKEPLEKWKSVLCNPVRKAWTRRYLRWIGQERLSVIGYEYANLLAELDSLPVRFKYLGSDTVRLLYGITNCVVEFGMLREKWRILPEWHKVHVHT